MRAARPAGRRRPARGLLAAALLAALLAAGCGSDAERASTAPTTFSEASGAAIAGEEGATVAATLALIDAGGPFAHDQDGATFQNREGLLPDQPGGYYREYTVETPGSDDRGARRLVIGSAGETYYTRDHYNSFIEIDPQDYR